MIINKLKYIMLDSYTLMAPEVESNAEVLGFNFDLRSGSILFGKDHKLDGQIQMSNMPIPSGYTLESILEEMVKNKQQTIEDLKDALIRADMLQNYTHPYGPDVRDSFVEDIERAKVALKFIRIPLTSKAYEERKKYVDESYELDRKDEEFKKAGRLLVNSQK